MSIFYHQLLIISWACGLSYLPSLKQFLSPPPINFCSKITNNAPKIAGMASEAPYRGLYLGSIFNLKPILLRFSQFSSNLTPGRVLIGTPKFFGRKSQNGILWSVSRTHGLDTVMQHKLQCTKNKCKRFWLLAKNASHAFGFKIFPDSVAKDSSTHAGVRQIERAGSCHDKIWLFLHDFVWICWNSPRPICFRRHKCRLKKKYFDCSMRFRNKKTKHFPAF